MKDSPIETFAEAKRSGQYHPETEKNWPENKPSTKIDPEEVFGSEVPIFSEPIYSFEDLRTPTKTDWFHTVMLILIFAAVLFIAIIGRNITINTKTAAVASPKVITKVVTKIKTKLKKVYITKTSDKWRHKLCYIYRDWNACLAYKKDLPFVARIGRKDIPR